MAGRETWTQLLILTLWLSPAISSRSPNILFIISDDLRTKSPFSNPDEDRPRPHTPNLDRLAESSIVFENAYVQYALCGPSRSSFLTSRRPDTTKVFAAYGNFRKEGGNFTTLPLYLKTHGYKTMGIGKVLDIGYEDKNDAVSWSEPYYFPSRSFDIWSGSQVSWQAVSKDEYEAHPLPDQLICDAAVKHLNVLGPAYKAGDSPFFLALGFLKPHLPFIFPEEFLADAEFYRPQFPYAPVGSPKIAWHDQAELTHYGDFEAFNITAAYNKSLPEWKSTELWRAYFSSVAYVDHLLGKVLDEVEKLELMEETVIVFLGDHGFHLGEQALWTKKTLFDMALRTPFIMRIPGHRSRTVTQLIELVDVFPTVVDAVGLPEIPVCAEDAQTFTYLCREGKSFFPLLQERDDNWKNVTFSQCHRGQYMGYSVRTSEFRYTEWVAYDMDEHSADWQDVTGVELYDFSVDRGETFNHAYELGYTVIRSSLRDLLQVGWRGLLLDDDNASPQIAPESSSHERLLSGSGNNRTETQKPAKVIRRFIKFR